MATCKPNRSERLQKVQLALAGTNLLGVLEELLVREKKQVGVSIAAVQMRKCGGRMQRTFPRMSFHCFCWRLRMEENEHGCVCVSGCCVGCAVVCGRGEARLTPLLCASHHAVVARS